MRPLSRAEGYNEEVGEHIADRDIRRRRGRLIRKGQEVGFYRCD